MIEVINISPQSSSFIPLSDFQAETPSSFFGSKPVLHLHLPATQVLCSPRDPVISNITPEVRSSNGSHVNGTSAPHASSGNERQVVKADVWVTSERLLLWCPARERGLSLQYPDIELHALQRLHLPGESEADDERQGVYLQLTSPSLEDGDDDEEDEEVLITEVTIIPRSGEAPPQHNGDAVPKPPAELLFQALSTCANLHPDPDSSDEDEDDDPYMCEGDVEGMVIPGTDDGSLPDPFPGSGGWITAENVNQYFDTDGQWLGRGDQNGEGTLGPGSGRVRNREEIERTDGNGIGGESEETKWQKTG